jgi:O-acetyl-ADP-ribose deacetylase (regulator of RNase III)
MRIIVKKGDITTESCDAIVNPANSRGWMGGGVAGAIKKAGGIEIEKEAVRKAPIPVGEAIVTTAGKLNAKYVIHAPTMERPMRIGIENVKQATRAALKCAIQNRLRKIVFPAMGTGVGGISLEDAAEAMVAEIKKCSFDLEIILIGLDDNFVNAFKKYV